MLARLLRNALIVQWLIGATVATAMVLWQGMGVGVALLLTVLFPVLVTVLAITYTMVVARPGESSVACTMVKSRT